MQTPEYHAAKRSGYLARLKPIAIERSAKTLALMLTLVALWLMTHRYQGLGGDAELYAVQAMARIHTNLLNDLFLRNTSQDAYTGFSRFYACCIAQFDLRNAALLLTIVFKIWFFGAAWALVRRLSDNHTAFLAVALLIITVGAYGAYGVFRYAEDWVTARSLAEALVITALALYFRGARVIGLLLACAAVFMHPLMALPGVLLLICLWCSRRMSIIGAAAGVLASLAVALNALRPSSTGHFFTVMDADWLEVVRERSQFLFLQLWSFADWLQNARPFMSLTLSAIAIGDPRVRKLCTSAMLVGATGLAVALIASLIGPVSVLLQGQAWRWVWVTGFTSVLLLAPTILAVWRDQNCGRLCSILMISAWALPPLAGAACMACAVVLWLLRIRIDARTTMLLHWVAVALAAVVVVWLIYTASAAWSRPPAAGREPLPMAFIRCIFGVQIFSVAIFGCLAYWLRANRPLPELWVTCGALVAISALMLPGAFRDTARDGIPAEIEKFRDWRLAIPPDSNVFVVPAHNSAAFAWFTLERPSYLTVDQSSGVVFSRATALEVRRRSQVLLPLMDPDWTLLSNMRRSHGGAAASSSPRALTRERFIKLCSDPELNFVVAKENIGFQPIRHTPPGNWRDWYLYDCRQVHFEIGGST